MEKHLQFAQLEESDDILHNVCSKLHREALDFHLRSAGNAIPHPIYVDEQVLPTGNKSGIDAILAVNTLVTRYVIR